MTLEFALVSATLIAVLLAFIDIGRYVATRTALRAAMGEVLRAAMTDEALVGAVTPKTLALSMAGLGSDNAG